MSDFRDVVSAPFVRFLATLAQLLTWTHPNRFAPFFLPLLWTALTLGGELGLRYAVNALLLATLGVGWLARRGSGSSADVLHGQRHRGPFRTSEWSRWPPGVSFGLMPHNSSW